MTMLRFTHRLSPRAGAFVLLAASGVWLSACGSVREAIGIDKSAPDEFAVVTKAPLVMPPDYTLRPPQPGAAGAAEVDPSAAARDALVTGAGGTPATATAPVESAPAPAPTAAPGSAPVPAPAADANSAGQSALLNAAGADRADPNIRENVNGEAQKSEDFTNQLLYGTPTGAAAPATASAPAGTPANAGAQGVPASASAPQPQPATTETAQKPEEEEEDEGWLDWF